ncbi:MAG TPA: hypothetical protein EYG03_06990 [Planctomycetes bacterium]|nr:hypothetical protein [Fuerstiella sp.]HIK91711.1 hypothetical protein [Planctomycetota bacterium]
MLRASIVAITAILSVFLSAVQADNRPKSLLTTVAEWQYPGAKMNGASVSDGATINQQGDRTVQSVHRKTVLTTADSVDKVVDYYKSKLNQKATPKKESQTGTGPSGRSVTFHSDSGERPVVIHVISINTDHTSTTLVISRAKAESETHIAWSQYEKFPRD